MPAEMMCVLGLLLYLENISTQAKLKMNTSQTKIGYAHTSTTDQNQDAQVAALKAVGCDIQQ